VGDIVTGYSIYRGQELEAAPPGWQTKVAAVLMLDLERLLLDLGVQSVTWLLLRGNHDRTQSGIDLARLTALEAQTLFDLDPRPCGWELVVHDGEHGIYFTHGFGYSMFRPQSPKFLTHVTKRIAALMRRGIPVDRVCHGHVHWLDLDFDWVDGIKIDSLGGLQACRRADLGFVQRPPGGALYRFTGDGIEVEAVRPDASWDMEAEDRGLYASNLVWMGESLRRAEAQQSELE